MFWPVLLGVLGVLFLLWLRARERRRLLVDASGKYVVVTGCDSGFGLMTARKLHTMGYHVICTCLSEDAVSRLERSPRMHGVQMQITSEESIKAACHNIRRLIPEGKGLWALINNAGVLGTTAPIEWLRRSSYQLCMEINCFGHISVTRELLPVLRASRGRVINMASIMGRICIPNTSVYNISKYAMQAFSDCLRKELSVFGIHVTTVEPGFFKTNITDPKLPAKNLRDSYEKLSPELQEVYGEEYVTEMCTRVPKFLDKMCSPRVELVVDSYVHAVSAQHPKTRYTVGADARYLLRALSLLPDWVQDTLARVTNKETLPAYMKRGAQLEK